MAMSCTSISGSAQNLFWKTPQAAYLRANAQSPHMHSGQYCLIAVMHVQGYGLHGWRVGYMAYPDRDGCDSLGLQLVKVQDTVVIHAAIISQKLALAALRHGPMQEEIDSLRQNR